MQVLYIGAGFVGVTAAAVAADSGHSVLVYDLNKERVFALKSRDREQIETYFSEKGLGDLLIRNKTRIDFTCDFFEASRFLDECSIVFICVQTPEIAETGESDMSFYEKALDDLGGALLCRNKNTQENFIVIANKSTVPIETADFAYDFLFQKGIKNFAVVSDPEFLVEGRAVEGALKPARVVVGANNEKERSVMRLFYERFYHSPDVTYIEVNPKEAAAGKLLSNFFLFARLGLCFDVLGRTCEAYEGVGFEEMRKILSSDPRIGSWGLFTGLYAGGSCLLKDAESLRFQLQQKNKDVSLVGAVYASNKRQFDLFLGRLTTDLNMEWKQKKVAILGLSFKRDTNDVRNAASTLAIPFLREAEVKKISGYDPVANESCKKIFPESIDLSYVESSGEAVKDADVILIATDWPEFRELDRIIMTQAKKNAVIMDGRRMLHHKYAELEQAGFSVIAVGSSPRKKCFF